MTICLRGNISGISHSHIRTCKSKEIILTSEVGKQLTRKIKQEERHILRTTEKEKDHYNKEMKKENNSKTATPTLCLREIIDWQTMFTQIPSFLNHSFNHSSEKQTTNNKESQQIFDANKFKCFKTDFFSEVYNV